MSLLMAEPVDKWIFLELTNSFLGHARSGGVPQCAAAGRISTLQQPPLLMGHQMQYLQHGPQPPPPPPLVMPAAGHPLPVYANRFAYRSRDTRRSLRK